MNMKWKAATLGIVSLSLAVTAAAIFANTPVLTYPTVRNPKTGSQEKAPDFSLKDLQGKTFTLSENKGPVLLVFGATWCPYCREEIPHLKAIKDAAAGKKYGRSPSRHTLRRRRACPPRGAPT